MTIKIFFCYDHEDEGLLKQLKNYLTPLQQLGLIELWYDRNISPGTEREKEISKHLNSARIILFLVSPDFMASNYYSTGVKRAIDRHKRGEARVIPIILRPCHWQADPLLSRLEVLPTNERPVTDWSSQGNAFLDVTKGIQKVINEMTTKTQGLIEQGIALRESRHHNEAIATFHTAIQLDPTNAQAYKELGITLRENKHHNEALVALNSAIQLDSISAQAHKELGITLRETQRYDEALAAFNSAIQLDPTNKAQNYQVYKEWGITLREGKRHNEAITTFNAAIQLDPTNAQAHKELGITLREARRYDEAITTFNAAIQLDPTNAQVHKELGIALRETQRYDEALAAFNSAIQLDPNNAQVHKELGIVLRAIERYWDALPSFTKAIEFDPDNSQVYKKEKARTLLAQGISFRKKELTCDALRAFSEALELDPSNSQTRKEQGIAFYQQGVDLYKHRHYEYAIVSFGKAIQDNPDDAHTYVKKREEALFQLRRG